MRLDKYLAETAQCTRREAKAQLAKGRVTVNGATIAGTLLPLAKDGKSVEVVVNMG